jgi:hypothetical protein
MRLVGARDLIFSAKPTDDGNRVLVRIGAHQFTAGRGEAIQLATEIVAAVEALQPEGSNP